MRGVSERPHRFDGPPRWTNIAQVLEAHQGEWVNLHAYGVTTEVWVPEGYKPARWSRLWLDRNGASVIVTDLDRVYGVEWGADE